MADGGGQKKPSGRQRKSGGARQAAGGAMPEASAHQLSGDSPAEQSTPAAAGTSTGSAFPQALQISLLPPLALSAAGAQAMRQAIAKANAGPPTGTITNPVIVDPCTDVAAPAAVDPRPEGFLAATGRFGFTRPLEPPPEQRPLKRYRTTTDQEETNLFILRHETDQAIRRAAEIHPEVVPEAVALRDRGLLVDAKTVAESGISAMAGLAEVSPQGCVIAGAVQSAQQNSPKEPRSPNCGVAGCKCFSCRKAADIEIQGWWATEFEARLMHDLTHAESRITGWLCGGCRWGCRSAAQTQLGRWGWWSSPESRALEIQWLFDSVTSATGPEWSVRFIWVEQQ